MVTADDVARAGRLGPAAAPRPRAGDRLRARPHPHAGLHRRARRRRPGRHARRHGRPRAPTRAGQPARPRRARHRPLRLGRPLRHARRLRPQRRGGVRAQRRALPVPALGPGGVRAAPGGAARTPASATRSTSSTWPGWWPPATARPSPTRSSAPTPTRPMVNGLGRARLGRRRHRGRGGACSGQPLSMLTPGWWASGCRASCPRARRPPTSSCGSPSCSAGHGVVGAFVEFYGPGVATVPSRTGPPSATCRPSTGRRSPSSPIDDETLRYLRFTGRPDDARRPRRGLRQGAGAVARPRRRRAGLLREARARPVARSCRAWPARPARRTGCRSTRPSALRRRARRLAARGRRQRRERRPAHARATATTRPSALSFPASDPPAATAGRRGPPRPTRRARRSARRTRATTSWAARTAGAGRPRRHSGLDRATTFEVDHGHVVIAAITSCTNTSNPSVMVAAGLLAAKAVERGLTAGRGSRRRSRPARRSSSTTSSGPGSCPTWTSSASTSSASAARPASATRARCCPRSAGRGRRARPGRGLGAVGQPQLRGPHQPRRAHELPGLAAAGRGLRPGRHDGRRPLRPSRSAPTPTASRCTCATSGRPRPRSTRSCEAVAARRTCSGRATPTSSTGDERWRALPVPDGDRYDVGPGRRPTCAARRTSTACPTSPAPLTDVAGARALAVLGDSVTTDHISPAGAIHPDSPAGRWLVEHGVEPRRLQLLRVPAGQPRGDDPGHVRQHPPAQPAGPRHRGRGHGAPARRRADDDLRGGASATGPRACRSWCWPARSTARGRPGTGRPRAPRCSACGRWWPRASSASTGRT